VFWIAGGKLADPKPRQGALRIEGSRITGKSAFAPPGATIKSAAGLTIVPAFVDAHVHLSVAGDPHIIAREQIRRGVVAVLDLGAPERLLPLRHPPLRIRFSGPLLTAPGGYPTASWGRNGEGLAVATPEEAVAAVRRLANAEARFVKLALDARFPMLDPAVAAAAAAEARKLGLLVAAHALEAESVRRALEAGADVLAHTPRDPLPDDLLARMRGKWVVSTLRAFAVGPERLRALQEAGARVVYGTDLGNEGTRPGIDAEELVAAATSEAATLLGLRDVGRLAVGASASLLAVQSLHPQDLARPEWVMIDGRMTV
jgi:imidazolonepropionase-like amidohydrolase